jgi:hypothetical protein
MNIAFQIEVLTNSDGSREIVNIDCDRLSLDTGKRLQDLADEAFRDLLKKYRRPVTLRDALRESVRMHPANDGPPQRRGQRG